MVHRDKTKQYEALVTSAGLFDPSTGADIQWLEDNEAELLAAMIAQQASGKTVDSYKDYLRQLLAGMPVMRIPTIQLKRIAAELALTVQWFSEWEIKDLSTDDKRQQLKEVAAGTRHPDHVGQRGHAWLSDRELYLWIDIERRQVSSPSVDRYLDYVGKLCYGRPVKRMNRDELQAIALEMGISVREFNMYDH